MSELGGRHAPVSRGVGDGARGSADCAADAAEGGFAPSALSFRSLLFDEVSSTNDEVKRAIDAGEAEGLVVRALRQSGGYGRQGRVWASPEGGLYCSLLLRPQVTPAVLPTLSLVVGMAVRRAVAALVDASAAGAVRIKWPNDVVVDRDVLHDARACAVGLDLAAQNHGHERFSDPNLTAFSQNTSSPVSASLKHRVQPRFCARGDADDTSSDAFASFSKLCGISCEAQGGGVCVGVGVNVVPPAERPDVGGKNEAAYVLDLAPEADFAFGGASRAIDRVFDEFLAAFASLYGRWQRDGFAPLLDEYNARASLTGREVTIEGRDGSPIAAGTVVRVDACGRLVLRSHDGTEVPIASGEAHVR